MIQTIRSGRVETSATAAQYAQHVRRCAAAGEKIVDYGAAHEGLGHPPPAQHIRILPPIEGLEHWKADMSARVPGGMTLGQLQDRLREADQWLPIDADEDMTVAEVIAHDVSGPLRLSHGTCRDLLLGLRYVDGAGELITVGGRTVKNVAGYDVTRLMVGSLNTLGLLVDANLRTWAVPPQIVRVEVRGVEPAALDPLMTGLLTGDAAPFYLEGRVRDGLFVLHIGYSGTPAGCDAQCRALGAWIAASSLMGEPPLRETGDLDADLLVRRAARAWRRGAMAHVKLSVPPAETGKTVQALQEMQPRPPFIDALPVHGSIHIGGDWSVAEAREADRRLGEILAACGGWRVWYRRPGNTELIAPFAPPQADWPMLMRIKNVMDPSGLFNPGRFP